MSKPVVSPLQLASYVECPRKYDFEYDQGIETPPDGERFRNRGLAYHIAIEETCDATDETDSDSEIAARALERFEEAWNHESSPSEYETRAHYRYDRHLSRAGVESYFVDGPGPEHARNSVATKLSVETEHKRVNVAGRIDNVVRTEDGLLLVDYVSSLNNVVSSRTVGKLEDHLGGKAYRPKLVKSAIQAAVYLEGIRDTKYFEKGMDTEFVYYALLHERDSTATDDGIQPEVAGKYRNVTNLCLDKHGTIWQLVREAYQGIRAMSYEPNRWPAIYENSCDNCSFMQMCPEYLSEEVKIE